MSGVKIDNETGADLSKEERKVISDQWKEIEACGVDISSAEVRGGGAPPRFHITFRKGEPSARARAHLEEKRYDVGQNLGEKNLSFYVTRRVEQGKGWSV